MSRQVDLVQIVHSGAPNTLVSEHETGWLDQVDGHVEARSQAEYGARILGNVGLVKSDTHDGDP